MTLRNFLSTILVAASIFAAANASASESTSPEKTTFLVIYRPGPAWPEGKLVTELPLREHGNYMLSLYAKGTMKMAGPLTNNEGGAVVLEVSSEAEALKVVANDPAVKANLFVHEIHPWAPVNWDYHLKKAQ